MIPDEIVEKVLETIDHATLFKLTTALVRINSVWDPDSGSSERDVAEYVAGWAERRGFNVQIDLVAPERPNVIVTWNAGPGERKEAKESAR